MLIILDEQKFEIHVHNKTIRFLRSVLRNTRVMIRFCFLEIAMYSFSLSKYAEMRNNLIDWCVYYNDVHQIGFAECV
jgi:hypothetical protein